VLSRVVFFLQAVTLECRLKVELQNSENQSQDQCPLYYPNAGTKLLQEYAEQALAEDVESGNCLIIDTSISMAYPMCDVLCS